MISVLVIAGMHRSGTSLLASCLSDCGIDMGSQLVPGNQRNRRGFFEDVDFLEFHEGLLKAHNLPVLVQEDFAFTPSNSETASARQIIARRVGKQRWGWKEPRTTLFLDFWSELLPQMRLLLLYRHPLDVYFSLLRAGDRGKLTLTEALNAWRIYNTKALNFISRHTGKHIILNIDAATGNPSAFAAALGSWLQVSPPVLQDAIQRRLAKDELRSSIADAALTAWLAQAYPDTLAILQQLDAHSSLQRTVPTNAPPHLRELLEHTAAIEDAHGASARIAKQNEHWALRVETELKHSRALAADNEAWARKAEDELQQSRTLSASNEAWARRLEGELQRARTLAENNEAWARRLEDELQRARTLAAEHERWAMQTEANLRAARQLAADNERWAQRLETDLKAARSLAADNEAWARGSDDLLVKARKEATDNKAWAERTEALLAAARSKNSSL